MEHAWKVSANTHGRSSRHSYAPSSGAQRDSAHRTTERNLVIGRRKLLPDMMPNMSLLVTPIIIVLTVLLSIFGRGVLARWLGLTNSSANRLIGVLLLQCGRSFSWGGSTSPPGHLSYPITVELYRSRGGSLYCWPFGPSACSARSFANHISSVEVVPFHAPHR